MAAAIASPAGPRRKVTYLSGTRADFGLMRGTLERVAAVAGLSIIATGTHLDASFGGTLGEIGAAGFRVSAQVPLDVSSRTRESMSAAIGECLAGVTRALARERPDILLLLGDRGEMLAGAIAALHLGIACAHVHGGERSGTVDEPVRHAISKLATWHFTATAQSRERLVRMGEMPERIFVSGAPGLDGLPDTPQREPAALREALGLPAGKPFVLALFHPVVQQAGDAARQTRAFAGALHRLGLPVAWLEPNADAGSLGVLGALRESPLPEGSRHIAHLDRALFCDAMRQCAVMAGNSSSGIIEAASFGTPVVNIGDRQRLRERNANTVDVAAHEADIHAALLAAVEHGRWPCDNVYGDGRAGERIAAWLATLPLTPALLEKANTY